MPSEELKTTQENKELLKPEQNSSSFGFQLKNFIKKHLGIVLLSTALIIVIVWFTLRLGIKEREFNNAKSQILIQSQIIQDSLQVKHLQFATEVFSWSVRSELLRNNVENLNQLFTLFVQESGADLIQLVNPEDRMILLSSDKKFEGIMYSGPLNFEVMKTEVIKVENEVKIFTPVMGFSKLIGVLVVEFKTSSI